MKSYLSHPVLLPVKLEGAIAAFPIASSPRWRVKRLRPFGGELQSWATKGWGGDPESTCYEAARRDRRVLICRSVLQQLDREG